MVFTGGASCETDTLSATVAPAPEFPQCPPVDLNTGCQFLIIASNNGTTIENDASQTAYEGSDDSLIGVVNNSSDPISSMPLSSPNSVLFGFDGDGICDVSAPVPAGCVPIPGSPAGSECGQGASCAFPTPPGEPAGNTEPGNITGSTQNGCEGPTTWYSNVSADTSSGVVNFSPALQPGQSTYFALEEPPTATSLAAGGGPQGGTFTAPPTVTATGATFSALVVPNGSPTTADFQYGLDAKYSKLGASGPTYTNTTPAQAVGGDFAESSRERRRLRTRAQRAVSRTPRRLQ